MKNEKNKIVKSRDSGIELLKIIAIFMIVISHVAQTVGQLPEEANVHYPEGAFINLLHATSNLQHFILQLFRYFGPIGNGIFFVCSAWFLLDSNKTKLLKIMQMVVDVWVISFVYLLVFLASSLNVSGKLIIQSMLPTMFGNNWYITFYILFYAIHPLLNVIIDNMGQKTLLTFCMISLPLYFGVSVVKSDLLFSSSLITYIVLYFVIAYIKKYMLKYSGNVGLNVKICIIAVLANICLTVATNLLGLTLGTRYAILREYVLVGAKNNSPIIALIAISLLNIFRNWHFTNRKINYISSLSLLVYILHENILIAKYFRTSVFIWLYEKFGYDYLVLWVVGFAVALFVVSIVMATFYRSVLQKLTRKIAKRITMLIENIYDRMLETVMKWG